MQGLSSRTGSMILIASTSMNMLVGISLGIEIGFSKLHGVDRLVILSPMPSNIDNVEEKKELVIIKIFELTAGL
jgi:hypothetical protein